MNHMNLGWEALKGLVAKFVQAVLGFAGTIIFARILGPTSFGGYYFLLSIITLVNRPILGIGNAAKKRFSESGAPRGEIISIILVSNILLSTIALVIIFSTNFLQGQTNVQSAEIVFLLILVSTIFFSPFQLIVDAAGMPGRSTWIDTLRSVFTFPLQLAFVLYGFGASGMGYGLAAATLLTIPLTYYTIGIKPRIPTTETCSSLWDFARYSIPSALVGKAYAQFDIILLGSLITTGIAGQYEVANKLTVPAIFLAGQITAGLMPRVSNLQSQAKDPTTDVTNALSYASILSIPIFFGAVALPQKLVVTAYGPEYAIAAPYLIGLAFYRVISSQKYVYRSTLSGLDLPRAILKFSMLALLVNIALGITFVYKFGGIGIVLATIIAESIQYFGTMYTVKSELPSIQIFPRTLLDQISAGIIMFFALRGVMSLLVLKSPFDVAFVVGCGALVYGLVLLFISHDLRMTLKRVYRDARGFV